MAATREIHKQHWIEVNRLEAAAATAAAIHQSLFRFVSISSIFILPLIDRIVSEKKTGEHTILLLLSLKKQKKGIQLCGVGVCVCK